MADDEIRLPPHLANRPIKGWDKLQDQLRDRERKFELLRSRYEKWAAARPGHPALTIPFKGWHVLVEPISGEPDAVEFICDEWPDMRTLKDHTISGEVRDRGRGMVIDVLTIKPGPITKKILGDLPLPQLLVVILRRLQRPLELNERSRDLWGVEFEPEDLELARRAQAKGGRSRPESELRIVALTHIAVCDSRGTAWGSHAQLATDLTSILGRPISDTGARDLVLAARKAGFLAPTKRGKAMPVRGPRLLQEQTE